MNLNDAQNELMDESLGLKPPATLSAPADGYSRPFGSEIPARSGAEMNQPAGLGTAGAQLQASEPNGSIQQLSDTERLDWIEKHRWEQNEAHGPYKAFCQIVMTHYGSVIPLREAIDLAMAVGGAEPAGAQDSPGTLASEPPAGNNDKLRDAAQ